MPLTMLNTSLLILVPFVFVALRRLFRYGNAHGAPYPPGPKKKFLVGNLLDLPTGQPWLTYTKLAKVHGIPNSFFIIESPVKKLTLL